MRRKWRICLRALLALCICALASPTRTQDPEPCLWRNVTVGGGFIPQIVFSRVEPNLAYARSDGRGIVYGEPAP